MADPEQHIAHYHPTDPREVHSSELMVHGHISVRTYTIVFIALMVLLAITVAAAQIPFAEHGVGQLGIVITFLVATVKAVLVVVYFMHVRYSTRLTKVFVVAGLLWLGILFALTLNDYLTRGWLPLSRGWTESPIVPRPAPTGGADVPAEGPARSPSGPRDIPPRGPGWLSHLYISLIPQEFPRRRGPFEV